MANFSEKVIWTLCPTGWTESGNLAFSVHVAPRLKINDGKTVTVKDAGAWSNWAASVKNFGFSLDLFAPGAVTPSQTLPATMTSALQVDICRAVFPLETPVNSYAYLDLRNALIMSYPIARMQDWLRGMYVKLADTQTDELPTRSALIKAGWPTANDRTHTGKEGPEPTIQQRIDDLRKNPDLQLLANATPAQLLEHFAVFHTPLLKTKPYKQKKGINGALENADWTGHERPALPSAAELAADVDLHRIAAAITNYPDLARACGLILDFEVKKADLKGLNIPALLSGNAPANIRLALKVQRAKKKPPTAAEVCPITGCHLDAAAFYAAPAGPGFIDGRYLDPAASGLSLIQMDVDGAAHKADSLSRSLDTMTHSMVTADDFDQNDLMRSPTATAPSLRSAGLMVAKSARYLDVAAEAKRTGGFEDHVYSIDPNKPKSALPSDLTAEDLKRGYRVDILDVRPGSTPRSLCRRIAYYEFRNAPDFPATLAAQLDWKKPDGSGKVGGQAAREQEVILGTGMTASPDPDTNTADIYKLHEGLFVWRGWSLAAPEPFESLSVKTDAPKSQAPNDVHAATVGSSVPDPVDAMPMEARFAVPYDAEKKVGSLPSLRFGHTYKVRIRTVDLAGGSVAYDTQGPEAAWSQPVTYLRHEPIEAPVLTLVSKGPLNYDALARLKAGEPFAPLATGYKTADLPYQGEGMRRMALRTYDGTMKDPVTGQLLSARNTISVRRNLAPPRVTARFAETNGALDDFYGKLRPELYGTLATQDYGFHNCEAPPADLLRPGSPDQAIWQAEKTRYAVSQSNFALPYIPDPHAVHVMAWLKTLDANPVSVRIPLYTSNPKAEWPTTRPIQIEGKESYSAFKFDDATRVLQVPMPKGCRHTLRLSCVMANETDINLFALWQMVNEDKPGDHSALKQWIRDGRHWMFTPWTEIELIHAVQRPLSVPKITAMSISRSYAATDAKIKSVTAATLSHRSTSRADLLAEWNEPEDHAENVDAKSGPANRVHAAVVTQTAVQRVPSESPYVIVDAVHHFPDTRYRRVNYRLQAVSRFSEFFEVDIRTNDAAMSVTSEGHTQWVRGTATPPAPKVLYAIPTFGWFKTPKASKVSGSRRTGGLRIYLDRPWLVTGYNELLAVVLPSADTTSTPEPVNTPTVTQWGRDAISQSAVIPTSSPKPTAFSLARFTGPITAPGTAVPVSESEVPPTSGSDFKTQGLPVPTLDGTFNIAPHEVGYDPVRQLWYADIAVAIPKGSYFPFLRLCVARYQPYSIPGCHLSAPVTCDFMQITPDRICVAVPLGDNSFRVFLYGDQAKKPVGFPNHPEIVQNQMRAGKIRIETQVRDAGADPVLGWRAAAGTALEAVLITEGIDGTTSLARRDVSKLELNVDKSGTSPFDAGKVQSRREATDPAAAAVSAAAGLNAAKLQELDGKAKAGAKPIAAALPAEIHDEVVLLPATPSGGARRILITETEAYPDGSGNLIERIVYVEAIEL